jgi:hypothetical protein
MKSPPTWAVTWIHLGHLARERVQSSLLWRPRASSSSMPCPARLPRPPTWGPRPLQTAKIDSKTSNHRIIESSNHRIIDFNGPAAAGEALQILIHLLIYMHTFNICIYIWLNKPPTSSVVKHIRFMYKSSILGGCHSCRNTDRHVRITVGKMVWSTDIRISPTVFRKAPQSLS